MDSGDLPLVKVGDLDHQTRLTQLRQFVSGGSLVKEEYRYLKILLSGVNTDIISELPIELVKYITELLDLRDFVTCLSVSRVWRDRLLSIPVISAFTDELCPSLRQASIGTQLDPDRCLKVLHKIGRMRLLRFESSLEKSFSWQHESYFKLDPEYHGHYEHTLSGYAQFDCQLHPESDSFLYQNALYSNGRIAWRPWPRIIVVDNLWSRTRKVFTSPNGPLTHPECELRCLGDRLVIASVDRLLVAWDYTTNVRLEKKLPGSIRYVTTKGSDVAIILFSGDVFLWEFGGKFSTLATAPLINHHGLTNELIKYWKSNLYVVFHPTCEKKLFLASGYTASSNSKSTLKRIVYEFDDANYTETFEFEVPSKSQRRRRCETSQVQIGKLMPYCRDTIGFREVYTLEELAASTIAFETFVGFDIYRRKFSARIDESFSSHTFGWVSRRKQGDMDFLVLFHDRGFTAYSFQPGFNFQIGE